MEGVTQRCTASSLYAEASEAHECCSVISYIDRLHRYSLATKNRQQHPTVLRSIFTCAAAYTIAYNQHMRRGPGIQLSEGLCTDLPGFQHVGSLAIASTASLNLS
jgi:hypothetical protein